MPERRAALVRYVTKYEQYLSKVQLSYTYALLRVSVRPYHEVCTLLGPIVTLEDGTDRLSRNFGNKLPFYATWNARRAQTPLTLRLKNEITQDRTAMMWVLEVYLFRLFNFWAFSQNCKKLLLVSFVMSVCPSAWNNSARLGRIFMKFDILVFWRICLENSSCSKIW